MPQFLELQNRYSICPEAIFLLLNELIHVVCFSISSWIISSTVMVSNTTCIFLNLKTVSLPQTYPLKFISISNYLPSISTVILNIILSLLKMLGFLPKPAHLLVSDIWTSHTEYPPISQAKIWGSYIEFSLFVDDIQSISNDARSTFKIDPSCFSSGPLQSILHTPATVLIRKHFA